MENVEKMPVQVTAKKGLNPLQKAILTVGTLALSAPAFAEGEVDVSAGTLVIAGAVGVIALVGAAKIVPNATMQVWGYVKQAFNRT